MKIWIWTGVVLAVAAAVVLAVRKKDEPSSTVADVAVPDPEGLAFFNGLSGTLHIEVTEPPEVVAPGLANKKATATARLKTLSMEMKVFLGEDFRALTEEELSRIVFRGKRIRLQGDAGEPIEHVAPNSAHFTVADMWRAVEETERRTRDQTEWLGGIDVHHVFYEGLSEAEPGCWFISWGS